MHSTGRPICALLLCVLLTHVSLSGAQQPAPQQPTASSTANKFVLDDGTPIKLRLDRNLSSADAKTGDNIDFEVLEEVKVNDVVVIPKGNLALGTVTAAEHKKHMARGGKLDIEIDYVKLADGEKAALRAVKETKGGGHTGAMTGAIVATSLVFWPAAPFFLFMHGKDTTIPKGTEITAYVSGAMPLDEARFPPKASPTAVANLQPGSPSATASPQEVIVEFRSTPTGADISVDGSMVGSTPSSISMSLGEHIIRISKQDFRTYERTMKVTAGHPVVAAYLEQLKATIQFDHQR
jgi:hypothetical protein